MELTPEAALGIMALFGTLIIVVLMILKRYGVIEFGGAKMCTEHTGFCTAFKKVKHEHIIQGEDIKHCQEGLEEGKVIFHIIKADIGEIKENIAVLLDRAQQTKKNDLKSWQND